MTTPPTCPKCNSGYTYESEGLFICPECGNEWATVEEIASTEELIARDANGTVLKDGEVLRRLGGYVKIKYQAESPEEQPAREVVERFKVLGLPAYVMLKPEE